MMRATNRAGGVGLDGTALGIGKRRLRGRREPFFDGVYQRLDARARKTGGNQNRDDLIVTALVAEIALDLVERGLDAFEQLLHQMIVEIGHRLQELDVQTIGGVGDVGGNRLFSLRRLRRSGARREAVSRHAREVDVTRERLRASERQLFGDDVAPVGVLQRGERLREIGARAVHLVDHEDVGHPKRLEVVDDSLRLHDARRIGLDDDDRGVDARQCLLRLFEEIDEPRRVDDGDVDVVGRRMCEAHRC